jgi:hypothetical protein
MSTVSKREWLDSKVVKISDFWPQSQKEWLDSKVVKISDFWSQCQEEWLDRKVVKISDSTRFEIVIRSLRSSLLCYPTTLFEIVIRSLTSSPLWYPATLFEIKHHSNITSFFCFVDKRAIYRLGIISLAHAPVHVTDFCRKCTCWWIIVCLNIKHYFRLISLVTKVI